MKKGNIGNIIRIILYLGAIVLLAYVQPTEVDWSDSYDVTHTKPYGSSAAFELLDDRVFSDLDIVKRPVYNVLEDSLIAQTNYVFIGEEQKWDGLDVEQLMSYVDRGNSAMIITDNLHKVIADTLGLSLTSSSYVSMESTDTLDLDSITFLASTNNKLYEVQKMRPLMKWADKDTSSRSSVLATYEGSPSLLKVPFGDGYFLLHTMPRLFTNYYLLKGSADYASNVLSLLPDRKTYYDQYYLKHKLAKKDSPLKVLIGMRGMQWVYWIAILGVLLFIFFRSRREQRAIPVLEEYKNDSKVFIETLGNLYLQEGSNREIAQKKLSQFKELLHKQYYIRNIDFSHEQSYALAKKSDVDNKEVSEIFRKIRLIESHPSPSDKELLELSRMIRLFE